MKTPAPPSGSLARLRELTPARVGLGRAGASLPTEALLGFTLDHARARDAVHAAFDISAQNARRRTDPEQRSCPLASCLIIARRASARPISTKAEVTSGPPTRMRVGVFILFHS